MFSINHEEEKEAFVLCLYIASFMLMIMGQPRSNEFFEQHFALHFHNLNIPADLNTRIKDYGINFAIADGKIFQLRASLGNRKTNIRGNVLNVGVISNESVCVPTHK